MLIEDRFDLGAEVNRVIFATGNAKRPKKDNQGVVSKATLVWHGIIKLAQKRRKRNNDWYLGQDVKW
jgi:hypothetical protein